MVLQTFIQNMLPKDTEGVYGKGLAGDMWKSQLAERVADVMAERGGIGIAKSMLADHYKDGKRTVPVGPVSTGPQKTEIDQQTRLSTSLVEELQRKAPAHGAMTGDETTIKTGHQESRPGFSMADFSKFSSNLPARTSEAPIPFARPGNLAAIIGRIEEAVEEETAGSEERHRL